MNCQDFQEQWFDLLDGTLSAGTRRDIDHHLAACDACRESLRAQRAMARTLSRQFRQNTEALRLKPEIRQRILSALPKASASEPERRSAAPVRSLLECLVRVFRRPALSWSLATCLLAAAVVIATRWLAPQNALAAESSVITSARVPHVVTSYTFQRQGQFVTDALVARAEIVHETSLVIHLPKSPAKTPIKDNAL